MDKITSLDERQVYALTHNLPVPKDVEQGLSTFYERFKKLEQEIAILDERMLNDPVGVIAEAIEVSSSDPFRKQVTYLFNKFEQPRRLARNAKRNEKLSRWREGRPTIILE